MLKSIPTRLVKFQSTKILLMIVLLAGCREDERVVEVAREAADRQAEQNRQIAHPCGSIAHAGTSFDVRDLLPQNPVGVSLRHWKTINYRNWH